jgi:hypothetical protein
MSADPKSTPLLSVEIEELDREASTQRTALMFSFWMMCLPLGIISIWRAVACHAHLDSCDHP